MATSRKKQDENNLKTLRELGAQPQNKFCFDCGQRGPTYVDVTIGSFVCTKCSGILRGLTPPHRVKSISMATFTPEEIDTLRSKGNDYCRKVWLGLYEGTPPTYNGDELQIRDFMVEKYERKRYYLEKAMTKIEVPNTRPSSTPIINGTTNQKVPNGLRNGLNKNITNKSNNNVQNGTLSNGVHTNGTSRSRPEIKSHTNGLNNNSLLEMYGFSAEPKATIFSESSQSSPVSSQSSLQDDFADFEHNQVFDATKATNGMPISNTFNTWSTNPTETHKQVWTSVAQPSFPLNPQNGVPNGLGTNPLANSNSQPAQDKYAALKDLDNEMKQQQQQDVWSTTNTGSTGSLYSSSTPTSGSVYGSPSPQGSNFGSPSQGQFMSAFTPFQENVNQISNPFGTNNVTQNPWTNTNSFTNGTTNGFTNGATNGLTNGATSGFTNSATNGFSNGTNGFSCLNNGFNGMQTTQQPFANPFKDQGKTNGFSNVLQPIFPNNGVPANGLSNGWSGNPFKQVGVASMNPNNPFL